MIPSFPAMQTMFQLPSLWAVPAFIYIESKRKYTMHIQAFPITPHLLKKDSLSLMLYLYVSHAAIKAVQMLPFHWTRLRHHRCAGETPSWQFACDTEYIYGIQDMSLILVHSCTYIWSTKISNPFCSGHFTNFPFFCEALTLCSLRFSYTNMFY